MQDTLLRVGIVGCGNIAGPYARDLVTHREIELVGVADLVAERAEALAAQYGCRAYPTPEALLADPGIDLAINLTVHHAHAAVTRQCLEAGKHVFSEKPLALTGRDAWELVALARDKGLRLGGSPFTVMGEAQQTAWKLIREGCLGTVRVAYAEVNWGRIETWHPAPGPFYEVGPLFDVGVYPLSILTAMFGPVRCVWARGHVVKPERVTKQGEPFRVTAPDFMVAVLEMESGPLVRLTCNFYVTQKGRQVGIEFHGDVASLYLESWHMFNSKVEMGEFNQPYHDVPPIREPYPGVEWGRAVVDMAHAIAEGRPHRAGGEQAAHVVDILCAAAESMQRGGPVAIASGFPRPAPADWAA